MGGGILRQGVAMKYAWIEEHRDEFTVSRMCRLLEVSRSRYCQWRTRAPSPRARDNDMLDARVVATHEMTPSMSRKATCRDTAAMESLFQTLKVELELDAA